MNLMEPNRHDNYCIIFTFMNKRKYLILVKIIIIILYFLIYFTPTINVLNVKTETLTQQQMKTILVLKNLYLKEAVEATGL